MTMEKIYSIHKKERMSNLLIISMQLITYLLMMMKIISINIMHHFYLQRTMRMYP